MLRRRSSTRIFSLIVIQRQQDQELAKSSHTFDVTGPGYKDTGEHYTPPSSPLLSLFPNTLINYSHGNFNLGESDYLGTTHSLRQQYLGDGTQNQTDSAADNQPVDNSWLTPLNPYGPRPKLLDFEWIAVQAENSDGEGDVPAEVSDLLTRRINGRWR